MITTDEPMRVAPDTVAPVPAATESPCRESPLYAPLTPSDLAIDWRASKFEALVVGAGIAALLGLLFFCCGFHC